MDFHFFAPKTIGSLVIGTGALGGGGVIYWHQLPTNWRELLTKEGFVFLTTENDYKGMFNDQKSTSDWTNESDLNEAQDTTVKGKAESYCSSKLSGSLSTSSDYESTRRKLIAFCTSGGIKTVKARLIQSQKKNWIEDSAEDSAEDKWKAVFAIYRYDNRFIDWLKEDKANGNLSSSSNVSEWAKLKDACSKLLSSSYSGLEGNKYFEYASWWCTDLGYTKVEDRIKALDTNWEKETDGKNIKNTWENTTSVTTQIKQDRSKQDLQDDDYKDWCEDQLKKELKKELKENDYYQNKYIMIKSVCRKRNST